MATPLTRQDMLAISDGAKNTIIGKMISRQDLQNISDNSQNRILNTLNTFHIETQTLVRQTAGQHDQMSRRLTAIESQVSAVRQEVRMLTQALNRLYEIQAQSLTQMRTGTPTFSTDQQDIR